MFRYPLLGLICLTMLVTTGCQSLDLFSNLSGKKPLLEADAEHPAVEVLCFWEPAEGRGLDNLPTRGFAGQVLFFCAGRTEPVKVEGDVRVYLFDDQGKVEEQSRPIHQFDFPAEVWNTYLRETNVGAAYQLFIPYTRKGIHEAECSLRVRFTPTNGLPLYSKMATITLPGKKVARPASETPPAELAHTQPAAAPAQVQHAAHQNISQPQAPAAARPNFSQTIRPSQVELTSGTQPAEGGPAVARRLDRLERMLETLVEQNQTQAPQPAPQTPQPETGRQRYRLAPTAHDAGPTQPATTHPLMESTSQTSAQAVPATPHPPAHPLAEAPAQWQNAGTAVPMEQAPPRHPLLD
ncbi:hypothetical protein [Maioricimonas sp. JC845]|uniref:hypothetical protein n=1 Tax=Maioricimonas sp. JC845 TaxID=3232138 RepID=UPI00345946E2